MPAAVLLTAIGGVIDFPDFQSETISSSSPASYTMKSNGSITTSNDLTGTLRWVVNTAPTNYEVYATVLSGALSSGSTGSWLNFSTDRSWTRNAPGTCTIELQLRDALSLAVVETVEITLEPS